MRTKKYHILPLILTVAIGVALYGKPSIPDSDSGEWVRIRRQAPQTLIKSIFTDPEGNIIVGAGESFHTLDSEKWKRHTYEDVLHNHTPFIMDPDGSLFFIDDNDLVVLDNGIVTRYSDLEIRAPVVGEFSDNGILYMGSYHLTKGGIFSFDGKTVEKIREGRVRSLTIDESGKLWATTVDPDTNNMILTSYEDGEWIDHSGDIQYLYPALTNELTVQAAPDGALWVNNLGKYGILRNGEWTFYSGGNGPVYLRFDSSGGVWGYGNKMLYKLNDSKKWEQVFVLESGTTYSPQFLTVTPDSIVWTFDDQNVYRYIEDKWKLYESGFDLASDVVTCHVYTENGDLLCGHGLRGIPPGEREDKGLSIRIGSEWQNDTKFGNTELLNVYQFAKMPDGEIMALTDGGYKQYYNYSWEKIDSVFVYNQYDMLFEEDETMWIASYYGLIEHAEDDYTLHIPFDEDKDIPVYNLSLVDEEYLYMQLLSGDIISFDGDIWETVTGSNSLINDFAVDDNLMIWAASQVSLAYWDKELNRFVDVVELDNGRFVYIDEQGKIWSSGHGNTGYFENGVWNSIPELSDYASDAISTSIDGRVALNVFDSEREEFFGLFEYRPQTMGVSHNEYRPEPLISTVNHPNPFNAITTITFELPKASNVSISVYSISGQLVKTIAEKRFPAGKNNVVWNSTSDTGRKLASGLYIYRIIAGSSVASGKMLLLR